LYRGVLDSRHLRAVTRTALRAHCLQLDRANFDRLTAVQQRIGVHLRDDVLPRVLPAFSVETYRALPNADPYLWQRLPVIAALGYRQAAALSAPGLASEAGKTVTLLGAAFNTAITLIDYLVDEQDATGLFAILNRGIVEAIFATGGDPQRDLAQAGKLNNGAVTGTIFGLVAGCAALGRRLLAASGNQQAWTALGEAVVRLFAAERATTVPSTSTAEATEAKSVLPSVVIARACSLALPPQIENDNAEAAAETLGRIFWRVDDIVDLIEDDRNARPNSLLELLRERVQASGRDAASDGDLYDLVNDIASELTDLIRSLPERAPLPVEGTSPLPEFSRHVIAAWVGLHEEPGRTGTLPVVREVESAAARATALLISLAEGGFAEAIHHLHFPRLNPAELRYETHPALLSHRAVALDALLDARDAGLNVPERVIAAEAIAILRSKHRDVRGGWSYVQEVPELPPDADDLGQVLQVLSRLGGTALAATCEEPLRLVLDSAWPDGGFSTWILDPRGRSPADDRIRAYLPVMGGWGRHAEVIANLLQGLIVHDPSRYAEPLTCGAAYLELVQAADGSWASRWYRGQFYGTYRALAVLTVLRPADVPTLARARMFLLGSRHDDGSFGQDGDGPLSTGLAALALASLGESAAAEDAVHTLLDYQDADGGWPACPWIVFGTTDGQEVYGSRTITTAFCLKALIAVSAGERR
jgi:squalene-hopene/tetraprenyl-beta-curcumene cyclase